MTSQEVVRSLLAAKGGHSPGDLAKLIDIIYEVEPFPGSWDLIPLSVDWLKRQLSFIAEPRVVASAHGYARLRTAPPPIILVGASEGGHTGLALLDGRRRLLAATLSKRVTIPAMLPSCIAAAAPTT